MPVSSVAAAIVAIECVETRRSEENRELRGVPPKTVNLSRVTRAQREQWRREEPKTNHWRPKTRQDCENVPRPCPYVGCRYNLYLDAHKHSIQFNFPDIEPHEMEHSCVLDIADEGEATLERCGRSMNVTRERVRQIEERTLVKLHKKVRRLV